MTEQGLLNIVVITIGGGLMLAFHLRSKKMRSLTSQGREKYRDDRERWLNGQSWGARFYKLLVVFLLICTCAHIVMTVWQKNEVREKYNAAGGNVILSVYGKYVESAENVYEIELFNGTSADVWVPPQSHAVTTVNDDGICAVVLNDHASGVSLLRVKPRNALYFKLMTSSTNRPMRASAVYYDKPIKGVRKSSRLLL